MNVYLLFAWLEGAPLLIGIFHSETIAKLRATEHGPGLYTVDQVALDQWPLSETITTTHVIELDEPAVFTVEPAYPGQDFTAEEVTDDRAYEPTVVRKPRKATRVGS